MSANPTQDIASTITVSGSTQVARSLFVAVEEYGTTCPSTPGLDGTFLSNASGDAIAAGSYSKQYTFTPTAAAPYLVCAYVDDSDYNTPDASGSVTFSIPAPPTEPQPSGTGPEGGNPPGAASQVPVAASLISPSATDAGGQVGWNPQFAWHGTPGARYALVIAQLYNDDAYHDVIQIEDDGFYDLSTTDCGPYSKGCTPQLYVLDDVASFALDGNGNGTARLVNAPPPGSYRWRVILLNADGTAAIDSNGHAIRPEPRGFSITGPPVRSLRVSTAMVTGSTSAYPGRVDLRIATTRYATVTLSYSHLGGKSVTSQYLSDSGNGTMTINMTCDHSGGIYRWTVTARGDVGRSRTARGRFPAVNTARCHAMRAAEAAAKRARDRAQRLAEIRREQQAAAQQQARINRFKNNCQAEGGTPVLIDNGDGTYSWYCRAPYGGLLSVPGGPY